MRPCASPHAPVAGHCGAHIRLDVRHHRSRKHLPIVALRRAAHPKRYPASSVLRAFPPPHSALSDRHQPQVGRHDRPRYRASRVACVSLVCMLSPLPRHSDWVPVSLTSPAVPAFPAWVDGSACATTFSRIAQRSLALRPAHSPSHLVTLYTRGYSHFVTSMTAPIASGWSENCRVGLSPTGKRRLSTAHTRSRHSCKFPERQL